jgi:glycosyltransferase involved in cell wall biosynthesis
MTRATFSNISELIESLTTQEVTYSGEMTNPPVVSVISSFYNAHQYFEETFKCVMNQTLQNFEWIIVDDCSTNEEAVKLFDGLEKRSSKIKLFRHEENKGPSAGRNTAISKASGKYLFFLDLDDLIDPTYLEKCAIFLELHPEFSFVNSYSVGFQEQEYLWEHGFEKAEQFIEQNWVTIMLMYRKEDFDALGGFDETLRFFEDWERWLRAFANGQKGWTIPEFLHCYRRTENGLLLSSLQIAETKKKVTDDIRLKYLRTFKKKAPSIGQWTAPNTTFDISNIRKSLSISNVIESGKDIGKKILFLFPHLVVGGADKFNLDLSELLKEKKYQMTIATTLHDSKQEWHEHFYKTTADIFYLSNFSYETDWFSLICYLIESRQIDCVFISNSYYAYYLLPLLRTKYRKVAFVDYVHAYDPNWRIDGYPRLSRQFSDFLDAKIVSSQYLANYNEEIEPNTEGTFSVCTTNIDTTKWNYSDFKREQIRQKHNISDKEILIIFPARLAPQKRPDFFVRIIKELTDCLLPIKVIILGNGDLIEPTHKLILELNLEEIIEIIPPVGPNLMSDYYSAADILLLPTAYEGIALTIYEAMAMQLPVVASDVGGQRELLIEGTGYLVRKGNSDDSEIEKYLKVLIPLITDKKLRQNLGKTARKRLEEFFTLDIMCQQIEGIIAKAVETRRSEISQNINEFLAEELLLVAIEFSRLETGWINLHRNLTENNSKRLSTNEDIDQLRIERDLLRLQKMNMEESKFWKVRQRWFSLKKIIGFAKDQY